MAKFCGNCGAKMDDAARVCGNCGTPFAAAPAPAQAPYQPAAQMPYQPPYQAQNGAAFQTAKKKDPKKIGLIAGAGAAALVVLILIISLISGGSGYKGAVKTFFKGLEKNDAKKVASVALLPSYFDEDDIEDLFELGDYKKVKYKIISKEKIDKDDLEELNEYIEAFTDSGKKVKKGYELKVKVTVKYKDGDSETDEETLYVLKVGSKWKVFMD